MTIRVDILLMILGMLLVTYLPRLLPAVLASKMHFGAGVEKFLRLIPYTAMAALIFPGILSVDASFAWVGLVGGAVAALLSAFRCSMTVSVLAAIGANLLIYLFFI